MTPTADVPPSSPPDGKTWVRGPERGETMMGEPQRQEVTFEDWRDAWQRHHTADAPLGRVELVRALAYGRLTIVSEEGSRLTLRNLHVDNVGLCKADIDMDIAHQRLLTDDVEYPRDGPLQGMFFGDDSAAVGDAFQMVVYDPRRHQRVLANLRKVVQLTIKPEELEGSKGYPDPVAANEE